MGREKPVNPWTSHLVVFLAGIVVGILAQPFFVPSNSPQVFIPDEVTHPVAPKCPPLPKCAPCVCSQSCPECPSYNQAGASVAAVETATSESCPSWWHRVKPDYMPGDVSRYWGEAMNSGWWFLGCKADVDEVLDLLKPFYRGPPHDGVFVDIGANLGQITENILQTFGNIPWSRYKYKFGMDGIYCKGDPHPGASVFMFEPQPNNARRIRERQDLSQWDLESVTLIEAAVSNYSGTAQFEFAGTFSETGSLGGRRADNGEGKIVTVQVTTFDEAYTEHMSGKKIFMMKTDTEGFDGTVIRGMQNVLAAKKIRFLTFEYHKLWFDNKTGDTLFAILQLLEGFGYFCYYIFPKRLFPISGSYWRPEYEMRKWSNVFCGQKDDFLLEKLVYMYGIANLGKFRDDVHDYKGKVGAMKFFFTGDSDPK